MLGQLKADPELSQIPVIMLTMVEERGAGIALGAADYLTKPIERDRLLQVLRTHTAEASAPVLVVDDEADQRELLRRILVKEGLEVMEANNGAEALERIAAREPSLVLLDLMMPELDGFQVVELTGKSLSESERERLEGFMVGTFEKRSIPREELLGRVRDLVKDRAGSNGVRDQSP